MITEKFWGGNVLPTTILDDLFKVVLLLLCGMLSMVRAYAPKFLFVTSIVL